MAKDHEDDLHHASGGNGSSSYSSPEFACPAPDTGASSGQAEVIHYSNY